jgi:hypothetical protein
VAAAAPEHTATGDKPMRRTLFFSSSLIVVSLWLICLAGVAARFSAQEPAPAPATPQAVNLSGWYSGELDAPERGLRGPAALTISGSRFTLTQQDVTQSGTIKVVSTERQTSVALRFEDGRTYSLRARKRGDELTLTSAPGEPNSFSFVGEPALFTRGGGRLPRPLPTPTADKKNVRGYTSSHTYSEFPNLPPPNSNEANGTPRVANANANRGRVVGFKAKAGGSSSAVRSAPASTSSAPTPTSSSEPAPTSAPAATPADEEQDDDEAILDRQLKKLRDGQLALQAPDQMQQGQTQTVTARIAFEDIGAKITSGLTGPAPTVEPAKVGSLMKVKLVPEQQDAFQITPQSSEEQVIKGKPYAEWVWAVTALKSGPQKLTLFATVNLKLEGRGEKSYEVTPIKKDIVVQVSYTYVVLSVLKDKENFKFIFGGLTLPALLGGLWKVIQKFRGGGTDSEPPSPPEPADD